MKKAAEEEAPIIFAEEAVHIKAQTPEFLGRALHSRERKLSPTTLA